MDNSLNVFTARPWRDYDQGLLWTVNDRSNTVIQLVVGVFFGLAQPCLQRIIAHLLGWICYCIDLCQGIIPQAGKPDEDDETTPFISKTARSCCCANNYCNKHWCRNAFAKISSLLIVIFGIAYTIAGTFVTIVPTDQAALSGSSKCGLWSLIDNAVPEAQDDDALIQGQKETQAGRYARDCYGPQSATSLDQCSLFKKPYVPTSKVDMEQQCPFVNETYCTGNGFTAVRFTTDLVDATSIGVNARDAPRFNRMMICVPLNVYQGFVEKTSIEDGWWGYNLGSVSSDEYTSNYTFRQYGDPFTYDVRSYTMSTYVHEYAKAPRDNYWIPIPGLNIRPELNHKSKPYSLTLMFINSCKIIYKEQSSDPIFPAEARSTIPNRYVNIDSRARPLACVDWIEVCTDRGKCLPPYDDRADHDKNHVFTRYALNKSTAYHATQFRGATGLDAQDKIQSATSMPLDKNPSQWIVESWRLFNTSLSRVQYDALAIANGTGWDEATYNQKMPIWPQENICQVFTFQLPKGYDNVRIWSTIGILFIPLGLWLIGMDTSTEFDEGEKKSEYFGDNKLMGIEWAYWKINLLLDTYRSLPQKPTNHEARNATIQVHSGGSDPQSNTLGKSSINVPTTNQLQTQSGSSQTQSSKISTRNYGSADIADQDSTVKPAAAVSERSRQASNPNTKQASKSAEHSEPTQPA